MGLALSDDLSDDLADDLADDLSDDPSAWWGEAPVLEGRSLRVAQHASAHNGALPSPHRSARGAIAPCRVGGVHGGRRGDGDGS